MREQTLPQPVARGHACSHSVATRPERLSYWRRRLSPRSEIECARKTAMTRVTSSKRTGLWRPFNDLGPADSLTPWSPARKTDSRFGYVLRQMAQTAQIVSMPRIARVCSDGELIERPGGGDRSAFEKLYRRYSRPMFGLALRRLGDHGRAEDAVQETFASVWRSARTYDPTRGPGAPWLYGIARNAIVDRSRARIEPPMEVPDVDSLEIGPADQAELAWIQWRVHGALERLPEQERELIALAYWSERSQSEIAAQLGIPLGTVKTRTRSALLRLAAILEGELE